MSDRLVIFNTTYDDVTGIKAKDERGNIITYTSGGGGSTTLNDIPNTSGTTGAITGNNIISGVIPITENGYYNVLNYAGANVNIPSISKYVNMDTTGMEVLYQAENLEFTGASGSYVDTEIQLFSQTNISKNFKIVIQDFFVDTSVGTETEGVRTALSTMLEQSPYPGFVLRGCAPASASAGNGLMGVINQTSYIALIISRNNGVLSFGVIPSFMIINTSNSIIRSTPIMVSGNMSNCTTIHNTPLTLGCEINTNGTPYRFCRCSMGSIVVAMEN